MGRGNWMVSAYDSDRCPVLGKLLGEMYRANEDGLARLVESGSSDVRAELALFCYRRSHLHALALATAASCSEGELVQLGGRVGSSLYAQACESQQAQPSLGGRKSITLSTKPIAVIVPLDEELEEDPGEVTPD